MAMAEDMERETEAYLARIRRTIAESSRLVEQAGLRIAETDRMLESQGLTREQVMGFKFTDAQREAVNRELARQGLEPIEEEDFSRRDAEAAETQSFSEGLRASGFSAPLRDEVAVTGELAERQRTFGMMMKPFQI